MDSGVNRNLSLDIIRILACMMIVLMHAPMPTGSENGVFLSTVSYLTAPGIGLFFMLSGALLLPMRTDIKTFLQRRFSRIAIPLLLWTSICLCLHCWVHGEPVTLRMVFSIPFSAQGNPVFWFLYTLLGLYLIAPILSRWLQNASFREIEFYLILWAVSLCYPLLRPVLDINTSETGLLYYLSGYVGYFVLGYYLKAFPERVRFKWMIPLALLSYAAPVICKLSKLSVDFYSVFWYLSIFVVIQCVFLWKLVLFVFPGQKASSSAPMVAHLSQLTFGIYLMHFFLIRDILWEWRFIQNIPSYPLQSVTMAGIAFIGSAFVSGMISLLPGSEYLIGVARKHRQKEHGTE